MRNKDFILLLTANADKTKHVRVFSGKWYTGADQIPESLARNIGRLTTLLDSQVKNGMLCDPQKEYLLIYNAQPSGLCGDSQITIDMLRRSRALIDDVDDMTGTPVHLVVDVDTGVVTNSTSALLKAGLIGEHDVSHENLEPPAEYGRMHDHPATTTFVTLESPLTLDLDAIWSGAFDSKTGVQQLGRLTAFPSIADAFHHLQRKSSCPTRGVLELACPLEKVDEVLETGLSKTVVKVLTPNTRTVHVTNNEEARKKEAVIEVELQRLAEAYPEFR
jgi:hypothetical protein